MTHLKSPPVKSIELSDGPFYYGFRRVPEVHSPEISKVRTATLVLCALAALGFAKLDSGWGVLVSFAVGLVALRWAMAYRGKSDG